MQVDNLCWAVVLDLSPGNTGIIQLDGKFVGERIQIEELCCDW
jgi:hypothetical protein